MFVTKTLGRKKRLNKEKDLTSDANMNDVTKLAKYLFLTEQMGQWKWKGLHLFGDKGGEVVGKELQQLHDMEGFWDFNPGTGTVCLGSRNKSTSAHDSLLKNASDQKSYQGNTCRIKFFMH